MLCHRCEWEGSKVRQPSAELYQEFKEWMNYILSDTAAKAGSSLFYLFDVPAPVKRIEGWLYEGNREPQMLQSWENPLNRPLSEVIAGVPPENWEDDLCR